jgi:hypothetical protein
MRLKQKYVITEHGEIIVFPEIIQHSRFRNFNPISAGFISFGLNEIGNPTCSCYGESYSLNLESRPEEDTVIAIRQLGMNYNY